MFFFWVTAQPHPQSSGDRPAAPPVVLDRPVEEPPSLAAVHLPAIAHVAGHVVDDVLPERYPGGPLECDGPADDFAALHGGTLL